MMKGRTVMPGLLAAVVVMSGCGPSREARLIKLYQGEAGPLIGKGAGDVLPLVTNRWDFQLVAKWDSVDPAPEAVLARNVAGAPFSRAEAETLFKDKGRYEVMIYADQGVKGEAHDYDPEPGMMHAPDSNTHRFTRHIMVRLVFRDKQLLDYRFFTFDAAG